MVEVSAAHVSNKGVHCLWRIYETVIKLSGNWFAFYCHHKLAILNNVSYKILVSEKKKETDHCGYFGV